MSICLVFHCNKAYTCGEFTYNKVLKFVKCLIWGKLNPLFLKDFLFGYMILQDNWANEAPLQKLYVNPNSIDVVKHIFLMLP